MRVRTGFSFNKLEKGIFSLLILLLPTQLGKHFWPHFAFIDGIRIDYLSPTLYITDILICFLFFLWLIKICYKKKINVRFPAKQYIFFIGFFLLTIFFSRNYLVGIYGLMKFLEYSFLFFYVIQSIPHVLSFKRLTALIASSTSIEAILAIGQYLTQGSLGGIWYFLGERTFSASTPGIANASINGELVMRAYGTFPHPNVLAGYLVVSMILIFFFLYPSKERFLRILASCSLLLGSIALILTLSRVAIAIWILFIGVLFVGQILRRKQKPKSQTYRWLLLIILFGIVFAHILAPRFLETSLTEEAIVQRQDLTKRTLEMVAERPVMGVGPGNFLFLLNDAQSPLLASYVLQPVHNIFLLVAAEIGIAGFLIFVWFLGKTYQRLFEKQYLASYFPISLSLSVIMILGMGDHYWLTLQQGQILFTLLLGLAWKKYIS